MCLCIVFGIFYGKKQQQCHTNVCMDIGVHMELTLTEKNV